MCVLARAVVARRPLYQNKQTDSSEEGKQQELNPQGKGGNVLRSTSVGRQGSRRGTG
jgi:hypothetical protein